jgi:hypothetical protein
LRHTGSTGGSHLLKVTAVRTSLVPRSKSESIVVYSGARLPPFAKRWRTVARARSERGR